MSESYEIYRGIGRLVTLRAAAEKGARRVTEADLSVIEKAAIVSRAGKIEWLGPETDLPSNHAKARSHDLGGATVIPALVECHTHLVFAGNRAGEFERRNRGETYQAIGAAGGGILASVRATRAASLEELVSSAQKRVDRFVAQGVGTIEAKSGYGLSVESETKMMRAAQKLTRARIVSTFLGAHAIAPEFTSAEEYVAHLMREALPLIAREKLATRVDIFLEKGYFERPVARRYLEAAKRLGFDLAVHADQLTLSGGADTAVDLGARSAEHLVQIGPPEIAKLAASETTCVLLPSADLYMDCAYPPARALIDRGARVAIATDFNPGSSPSQDVSLVGVLSRVRMKMSFPETLAAYTIGAAYALGLEKQTGSLEIGKSCDFAILDGSLDELFLEIGRAPVSSVVVEGLQV
ncbi:MAG: imidazolonepropionase [Bdellovibrionota bacterium]